MEDNNGLGGSPNLCPECGHPEPNLFNTNELLIVFANRLAQLTEIVENMASGFDAFSARLMSAEHNIELVREAILGDDGYFNA
jgi:hypothetical protein